MEKSLKSMDWENQIVKMSILLKLMRRFNEITVTIPVSYFSGIVKLILKFIWQVKRSRLADTILKETRVGGPPTPSFKTCYKATVIKPA